MGIHKHSRGTIFRMKHAQLDRKENGDVVGLWKPNNTTIYEYVFIGESVGKLTLNGETISKHPRFKNISSFESWCMRYSAEH